MKLIPTTNLCIEHGLNYKQALTTLTAAGIAPRMMSGAAHKQSRWWGPEAKVPLAAERMRIDTERKARRALKAPPAAQATPTGPEVSDSVDGVMGDVSRQNCVVLGLLRHICAAVEQPTIVVLAGDDKAALSSLAAQGQGAAATAADTRALVVSVARDVADLGARWGRIEAMVDHLLDVATKPDDVFLADVVMAAVVNGHDDAPR